MPKGATCADDNACMQPDGCLAGDCTGPEVKCVDGDPCTLDDQCDGLVGCVYPLSPEAACDDKNSCTADGCKEGAGCTHAPLDGTLCDGGSACTRNDLCATGSCKGTPGLCDDGNPCTDDACKPDGKTCGFTPNFGPCSAARFCKQGRCGGCEAWTERLRSGCTLVYPTTSVKIPKGCGGNDNLQKEALFGATALSDGRIVPVGQTTTGSTAAAVTGWARWFEPWGAPTGEATYGTSGSDRLRAAAAAPAGAAWLVGAKQDASANVRAWLLKVDGAGKVLGESVLAAEVTAAAQAELAAVATWPGPKGPASDGGAMAVGATDALASAAADGLAVRYDVVGKPLWWKVYGQPKDSPMLVDRFSPCTLRPMRRTWCLPVSAVGLVAPSGSNRAGSCGSMRPATCSGSTTTVARATTPSTASGASPTVRSRQPVCATR
jgi:hypothetical protein